MRKTKTNLILPALLYGSTYFQANTMIWNIFRRNLQTCRGGFQSGAIYRSSQYQCCHVLMCKGGYSEMGDISTKEITGLFTCKHTGSNSSITDEVRCVFNTAKFSLFKIILCLLFCSLLTLTVCCFTCNFATLKGQHFAILVIVLQWIRPGRSFFLKL